MIIGIIPARYASSRFPGKPLVDIQGKSMIQRVYEQAIQAKKLDKVVIATDDQRIATHVQTFGATPIMTKENHPSGTDRCFEAALAVVNAGKNANEIQDASTIVVNIQGDEPFISPEQIDLLCQTLIESNLPIATLAIPVDSEELLFNEGEVKIAMNANKEALYFSRSPIPYLKGLAKDQWHKHYPYFRHVGLYAYKMQTLTAITQLQPSPLEKAESLEQLRWLENGFKIQVGITLHDSHCIDTPEDIERVLHYFQPK